MHFKTLERGASRMSVGTARQTAAGCFRALCFRRDRSFRRSSAHLSEFIATAPAF
jgi:hypothetical protein